MNSTLKKHLIYSLAGATLLTAVAATGLWRTLDRWAQDELFQKVSANSGDIVIIGIDEAALSDALVQISSLSPNPHQAR